MQAIILAAGMGKRLGELTRDDTKCMLSVGGRRLIDRALDAIEHAGITTATIVVGYCGGHVRDYVGTRHGGMQVHYIDNKDYATTNNIFSLYLAKDLLLADDTVLLESDLVFEERLLQKLVSDPCPDLALVAHYESWMDGTVVSLDDENRLLQFSGSQFALHSAQMALDDRGVKKWYKTVNIYKFSRSFSQRYYVPFLEAYIGAMGHNQYYEEVLKVLSLLNDSPLRALRVDDERWYEIDDAQDLDMAESLFADDEKRYDVVASRYGGYWRYAGLLDYCYLVNPYFPPCELVEDVKREFDMLLRQYPLGMRVNSLLAAKMFGLKAEHIVVGNGAAELIKALADLALQRSDPRTRRHERWGVIAPSFEEYGNRMGPDRVVRMVVDDDFAYTADTIMTFPGFQHAETPFTIILVNPDNPSGNYIPRDEVLRLLSWCESKGYNLVVDESFADFVDAEGSVSLLDDGLLDAHPRLAVVKSISKSYGVPGLRLGIVASGDRGLVADMKRNVAIWNINAFAEFYLQVYERYKSDYAKACRRLVEERGRFAESLDRVPFLRCLPSQSNYFLCEVLAPFTARRLAVELLKRNVFVKDCSSKQGIEGREFVRIAIRDAKDNNYLVACLSSLAENNKC